MTPRTRALLLSIATCGALAAGCQQTSAPVRREILGSWSSNDLAGSTIRMTVSETARSVDGAGALSGTSGGFAFRVFGALARDEVSLYFDFEGRPDFSFQGFFRTADRMEGFLNGGGFSSQPVSFTREPLPR